jgi:anaerobic dimethyl sulfoxide reductase subunit A
MSLATGAVAVSGSGLLSSQGRQTAAVKDSTQVVTKERHQQILDDIKLKRAGEVVKTTKCHCSTCLVNIRSRDGVVTAIEPNSELFFPGVAREDSVATDLDLIKHRVNMRGCAMGLSDQWEAYKNPSRLRYPLVRLAGSKRGEPKFVRATWEEAITRCADELIKAKELYGPLSILACYGTYPNSGNYGRLASWFEAGVGGWGYCTWDAQRLTQQMMFGWLGFGASAPSGTSADWLMNSKLIVNYGWTPTTTHHANYQDGYYLQLARERGTPIITIDPRVSTEAECQTDQYIPIKPGTGTAFWLAVANVLINEGRYDQAYLDRYTYGFDRFKAFVIGHEDGIPKNPEWAEKICAIPAETITAFARFYADNQPCYLKLHFGAVRRAMAENEGRIAVILQCMMGAIGVPGGFTTLRGASGVSMPSCACPTTPETPAKSGWNPNYPVPNPFRLHKWAEGILLLDDVKSWKLSRKEYDRLVGNATPERGTPNYYLSFVTKNSIDTGAHSCERGAQALQSLGFVFGLQPHMTSTAKHCDVLLPEQIFSEKPGYGGGSAGYNVMAAMPKCFDEVGEQRDTELIFTLIMEKLGLLDKYAPYFTTVEEWDDVVWERTRIGYEDNFIPSMNAKGYDVPTWEEFQEKGAVVYDEYEHDEPYFYPWKDVIDAGQLPTETGKIEIYNRYLEVTDPMEPLFAGTNEMTVVGYPLPPIPKYMRPEMAIDSPMVKDYPLTLLSSHSRHRWFSAHDSNPAVYGEITRHRVWMSVSDAKARGIKDEDEVYVYNQMGRAILKAYVTNRMAPGVVVIRYGAWYDPNKQGIDMRGSCNSFTNALDGSPHWPAHCTALVEIEPLSGSGTPGEF